MKSKQYTEPLDHQSLRKHLQDVYKVEIIEKAPL